MRGNRETQPKLEFLTKTLEIASSNTGAAGVEEMINYLAGIVDCANAFLVIDDQAQGLSIISSADDDSKTKEGILEYLSEVKRVGCFPLGGKAKDYCRSWNERLGDGRYIRNGVQKTEAFPVLDEPCKVYLFFEFNRKAENLTLSHLEREIMLRFLRIVSKNYFLEKSVSSFRCIENEISMKDRNSFLQKDVAGYDAICVISIPDFIARAEKYGKQHAIEAVRLLKGMVSKTGEDIYSIGFGVYVFLWRGSPEDCVDWIGIVSDNLYEQFRRMKVSAAIAPLKPNLRFALYTCEHECIDEYYGGSRIRYIPLTEDSGYYGSNVIPMDTYTVTEDDSVEIENGILVPAVLEATI